MALPGLRYGLGSKRRDLAVWTIHRAWRLPANCPAATAIMQRRLGLDLGQSRPVGQNRRSMVSAALPILLQSEISLWRHRSERCAEPCLNLPRTREDPDDCRCLVFAILLLPRRYRGKYLEISIRRRAGSVSRQINPDTARLGTARARGNLSISEIGRASCRERV